MTTYGFFQSLVQDLGGERGRLRLLLQPLLAMLLGAKFGVSDAKAGLPPFLLRFTHPTGKRDLFRQSVREAILPLTVAFVVDAVLQRLSLGRIRPLAAVIVGLLLVWLPFAIARALVNRVWTRGHASRRTA